MCFGSNSDTKGDNDNLNARPASTTKSHPPPQQPTTSQMPSSSAQDSKSYPPPSGPPPSHNTQQASSYAPPPGPPPSQAGLARHEYYAPPPGPPPPSESSQPYHDWQTAVPDTSLLPPPPSLGNQRSATNNATEIEAEQGKEWCISNPLYGPVSLSPQSAQALASGEIGVVVPRSYKGVLNRIAPGVWKGATQKGCTDSCILSTVPLYSVYTHSPLQTGSSKTVYYEVRIAHSNRAEVSLALGFTAPPYPTFRLPGWHRGSLGVHGDDGSRFVNDMWGGRDFTAPFKPGETIGLGMIYSRNDLTAPPAYVDASAGNTAPAVTVPINVDVFLTRDGKKVAGWNLHEENDAQEDLPVTGLEGFHDLLAAVGTFENVEFDIVFDASQWLYEF